MAFAARGLLACRALVARVVLFGVCLGATAVSSRGAAHGPQSGLDQAVAAVREQRFAEALAAARAEPDDILRAQAELYVFHQAGSLDDALAAGMAGLLLAPQDTWLLEQTAFVALTLGLGARAERDLDELERVAPGQASDWMVQQAGELKLQRADERRALSRARRVALALLAVAAAGIAFGARGARDEPDVPQG